MLIFVAEDVKRAALSSMKYTLVEVYVCVFRKESGVGSTFNLIQLQEIYFPYISSSYFSILTRDTKLRFCLLVFFKLFTENDVAPTMLGVFYVALVLTKYVLLRQQ